MPILLPTIRLASRIAKSRTAQIRKDCFCEEFLIAHKNLLFKMRIVKQEFIRLLKEIIKRDCEYIEFLWKQNCFQEILKQIQSEDTATKKEALNLMKYVVISQFHNQNIMYPLITKMEFTETLINTLQEKDPEILQDCLDSLYIMLKENEIHLIKFVIDKLEGSSGVKMIENLQMHKNQWICEKAVKILELLLAEAEIMEK